MRAPFLVSLGLVVALSSGCPAPEAPAGDAGADGRAPSSCDSDADCDDGAFCNGIETCGASGTCVRGMSPCAAADCDEAVNRCDCTMADADGDGQDSMACGGLDCDDDDGQRAPGRAEVCDTAMHDEDCNADTYGFVDLDSDGYVSAACCNVRADGTSSCGDDCDDMRPTAHPAATEACDGFDNDCDIGVDEGVQTAFYLDADADGYGVTGATTTACDAPVGYTDQPGDCDDAVPTTHPGARDECNTRNDDCLGGADDDPAIPCSCTTGLTEACPQPGICAGGTRSCVAGTWGPCSVTGTAETCDGVDQDCDGGADEAPAAGTCPIRPPNSTVTCTAGVCGFVCDTGYAPVGSSCVPPQPPHPIGPLTGQVVTSRHPWIRWQLGASSDGARVQICGDAACTSVVATQDATGTTLSLAAALAPGVYYWRAAGRLGAVTGLGFSVAHRFVSSAIADTTYATVGSTVLDPDGNGADVVVGRNPEARLFSSSGAAVDATADALLDGRPAIGFGFSVAPAGDVNGDGRGDLVVGACAGAPAPPVAGCSAAPCPPDASTCANRAYVYYATGSPAAYASTARTEIIAPVGANGFGYSVGDAGDVNADGYADVVIGSYWTSHVYVYFGSATGLALTGYADIAPFGATAGPAGGFFGLSVDGAGDFNSDGYGDVVIGQPLVPAGSAFVYYGPTLAMRSSLLAEWGSASNAGISVSGAGDFNGDGLPDVVVGGNGNPGSPGSPQDLPAAGLMLVFAGGLGMPPAIQRNGYALGGFANQGHGVSVVGVGDATGDGLSDVLVGAPGAVSAYLYPGRAGGAASSVLFSAFALNGPAGFGRWVGAPGDVNLDGRADLVVAAAPHGYLYLADGTLHATFTGACDGGVPR